MKTIPVKSRHGNYPILAGRNLLAKTALFLKRAGLNGKVLVVTQPGIARFHLPALTQSLTRHGVRFKVHEIPDGEEAKSEKELFRIFHALVEGGYERGDLILALGGGVVSDAAGFAAAAYLRGIAYVNLGTTLLAQVDSSIGGKTGINLRAGKNLVGSFWPPRLVISDVSVLATLPGRELHASLAEVVKYGVIRDPALFGLLEKKALRVLQKDPGVLETIVVRSARIKAVVVGRDEFETKGERMILNFGHTFAHGFEQALGYRKLRHGEAVSIGMVCAARLARALDLFSNANCRRLVRLLGDLQLPVDLSGLGLHADEILTAMARDKKKKDGRLRFVLPVRIGKVVVRENIPPALVRKIILESGAK